MKNERRKDVRRLEDKTGDNQRDNPIQYGTHHLFAVGAYSGGASPRSMVDNKNNTDSDAKRKRSKRLDGKEE